MTKNSYREFFAQCKPVVKLTTVCKLAGINPVNFSRFMKGEEFNWCLSLQTLSRIYNTLQDELSKLT